MEIFKFGFFFLITIFVAAVVGAAAGATVVGTVVGSMESLLSSVKTRQGEYAEVMISGPHGYTIGRLILDPFSSILYSTKAEDFSTVKHLMRSGLDVGEAVEQVANLTRTAP